MASASLLRLGPVGSPVRTLSLRSVSTAAFESAGVPSFLAHGLRHAFPHITSPLRFQAKLIRAVLARDNVLLKGHTGKGKSFALALAVLAQSFAPPPIGLSHSSLILVPHRDLAAQYYFWLTTLLAASTPPASHPARVDAANISLLARGYMDPSNLTRSAFFRKPTSSSPSPSARIVIATPQALLDLLAPSPADSKPKHKPKNKGKGKGKSKHASTDTDNDGLVAAAHAGAFTTAVIDELDALVDFVPRDASRNEARRIARKETRHVALAARILDALVAESPRERPPSQVVLCSATFPGGLEDRVEERGWLSSAPVVTRVAVAKGEGAGASEGEGEGVRSSRAHVVHHALVVGPDGVVRNHPAARRRSEEKEPESEGEARPEEHGRAVERLLQETDDADDGRILKGLEPEQIKQFMTTPSPFRVGALEAVAELFALEVRERALLVLPAELPVHRCVWELRELGVDARALDVRGEMGGLLRARRDGEGEGEGEPTLLVSTEATTRGLDVYRLEHVFVYGVAAGYGRVDTFKHVAGRVGRLGRARASAGVGKPGKVVTIVMGRGDRHHDQVQADADARAAGVPARLVERDEVRALGEIHCVQAGPGLRMSSVNWLGPPARTGGIRTAQSKCGLAATSVGVGAS